MAETGQPYAYTADDPLNLTDPLGLSIIKPARLWTKSTLPDVEDNSKLWRVLNRLWKYDAEGHVGNGSSMDAVLEEAKTGQGTRGVFHEGELVNGEEGLDNLLEGRSLTSFQRVVAYEAREYVQSSLRTFDNAVEGGVISEGDLGPTRFAQASARYESSLVGTGPDAAPAPSEPPEFGTDPAGGASGGDGDGVPDVLPPPIE